MSVTWRGEQLTEGLRLAIMRGLVTVANLVRNEAVTSITSGARSGNKYRRRGVVRVASAPGEPPARDLGNLHSNITVTNINPALLMVSVNSAAIYSAALEFGTRKMAARPFMQRALMKHIASVDRIVSAEVTRYLATQPSK